MVKTVKIAQFDFVHYDTWVVSVRCHVPRWSWPGPTLCSVSHRRCRSTAVQCCLPVHRSPQLLTLRPAAEVRSCLRKRRMSTTPRWPSPGCNRHRPQRRRFLSHLTSLFEIVSSVTGVLTMTPRGTYVQRRNFCRRLMTMTMPRHWPNFAEPKMTPLFFWHPNSSTELFPAGPKPGI